MSEHFLARHATQTGVFEVPADLARVFHCFTPEGERSWVPDWEPQYLAPDRADLSPGVVFVTRHGGAETLWVVVSADPHRGLATYARLTPGSHVGLVEIRCRTRTERSTEVGVTYRLTALTPEGNEVLAKFDAAAFQRMLAEWRDRVTEHLGAR